MHRRIFLLLAMVLAAIVALPHARAQYVQFEAAEGAFPLVREGRAAPIHVDGEDLPGVARAAGDLRADIERVTGVQPELATTDPAGAQAVLIGTLGRSRLIDRLAADRKIDATLIEGQWEAFLIEVVANPLPGLDSALVIAGSDRRGTIYGIYDLSEEIGVSPWYWWADVPPTRHDALFIRPGRHLEGPPAVKYRGIFINDEEPAFGPWAREKFGGINSKMYAHMFELILRLKGNYLWPAMWGKSIYEDDPESPRIANEYGIVLGTSHHEPMNRAHVDWSRNGRGPWNYATNEEVLKEFWTEGIRRNAEYETIVTIGMRGDGDEPMIEGGDMQANIALLEKIVRDQREIIAEHLNPDVTQVPQMWALYKEVMDYYENGMRVPDDVTLLWCDDNWGNIRRLPTPEEQGRSGGAGIYYHFDYVGGPRNYKWINTNRLAKIWEQMNLALEYGADRIWIVNVGDLKPMEFPIDFFLTMAWNPQEVTKDRIVEFSRNWTAQQFGPEHAEEIADLILRYQRLAGRRTPELLGPETFSVVNYGEADRVVADYQELAQRAETVKAQLPEEMHPAFFQLVQHPIIAMGQVTELYVATARNRLYADQGRVTANDMAERVRELFAADQALTDAYHTMLDGKWNHMMAQTHIGYTSWQEPPRNVMPRVEEITPLDTPTLAIAVEGSSDAWPGAQAPAELPTMDVFNRQSRYIDVFNRGRGEVRFTASASEPWIVLSETEGTFEKEERLTVTIDWDRAPEGTATGTVTIRQAGADTQPVQVAVTAFRPAEPTPETLNGFVEANGYVSIEAAHFTRKTEAGGVTWDEIPGYGRTLSGMSVFPVTAESVTNPGPETSPCLEYRMYLFEPGIVDVWTVFGPTLDFVPGRGLRYAVSFDDAPPQIIELVPPGRGQLPRDWNRVVGDSARWSASKHLIAEPGYHTLKIWMVDPAVVLEKIVVDRGGAKQSYLGPPESFRN